MPHTYSQNHPARGFQHERNGASWSRKNSSQSCGPTWPESGRNNGFLVLANGGMEDHAHLLIQLPATLASGQSSAIAQRQFLKMGGRPWTGVLDGKKATAHSASASPSVSAVAKYIASQEAHHRKITFEDEFIALLEKHGIEYDPRYVFG